MAKDKNRTQSYRLTMEFTLQDRGDYTLATNKFRDVLVEVGEKFIGMIIDYIAVEKIADRLEDPKHGD